VPQLWRAPVRPAWFPHVVATEAACPTARIVHPVSCILFAAHLLSSQL